MRTTLIASAFVTIVLLLSLPTRAQQACNNWLLETQSIFNAHSTAVFEGDSGIIVSAGYFEGDSALLQLNNYNQLPASSSVSIYHSSVVGTTLYISKRGPVSNPTLEWQTTINCTGASEITDIAYKDGAIYITGYYYGIITFDHLIAQSSGVRDCFLAKYDAAGQIEWIQQGKGPQWEMGNALVLDDNNVYVTGYYMNSAVFGANTLTAAYNTEMFVASYPQQAGPVNWITTLEGSIGKDESTGIAIDTSGNLYISGFTEGGMPFGTATINSNGFRDVLVAQLDAQGNINWITTFGGTDYDAGNDIAYDANSNSLYIGGSWQSDSTVILGDTVPTWGSVDAFIANVSAAGNLQWIETAGSVEMDWIMAVDVAANGDVIGVGAYGAPLNFRHIVLANGHSAPDSTGLLLRLDASGNAMAALAFGGGGQDMAQDVSTGKSPATQNTITIAGFYEGQATFGNNSVSATGMQDGFLWSLCDSIIYSANLVWPGDADNNGVANNWDILPVGLLYGSAGPARPNASPIWVGQPAFDWGTQFINGADYKHTDCDGNGIINGLDLAPILANYGLTHPKQEQEGRIGDALLYVELLENSVPAGDTATLIVYLATVDSPLQQMYGLAFSLYYDPLLFETGSFATDYSNSWLGNLGNDMIKLDIEVPASGKFDVGMVRTNLSPANGYGELMRVSVITIDNISGKDLVDMATPITIANVSAINHTGSEIVLDTEGDTLTLLGVETGIHSPDRLKFILYPNPSQGNFAVNAAENIDEIHIVDGLGRIMLAQNNWQSNSINIDTEAWPAGIYFIKLRSGNRWAQQKLLIAK